MAEGGNSPEVLQRSQRGRPSCKIDSGEVHFLLSKGFSKSKIAEILGVSRQTEYNRISAWGQSQFHKYSTMSDASLALKVRDIKATHPHYGEVMVAGHLMSQGMQVQRTKLRESIHRIDPVGTAERSVAVRWRVYHVDAAKTCGTLMEIIN